MTAVLVTRPRAEAAETAAALRSLGHHPVLAPLLEIRPLPGPALDLAGVQALAVTSVNGVRALAGRTGRRDLPLFAVGGRTAREAATAGFRTIHTADGDARGLAALLAGTLDPAAGAVLHLGGREQAADLGLLLAPAGLPVRRVIGYAAEAVPALPAEADTALRRGGVVAALFFSPRSARLFVSLAQAAGLGDSCRTVTACCLSPAVADAATALPWRSVRTAQRPDQTALLALLPPAAGT
ncbi:uroporphyrinogen-III synthase [Oleisolibacter albus]|uniref:uroporphyrinogen-III synthase n=1 Tax=Oleisolibacter albus TaxID=2171757 RepID=UPI000DF3FD46|nr:uroporphyrinogen-III synthase [Oleisolibacter albus]